LKTQYRITSAIVDNCKNRDCTFAIQSVLDKASCCSGEVIIEKGVYLTGALFVKSHTTLFLEKGAVLLGICDEAAYPILPGRVAGIEMDWMSGLLNVQNAMQVYICGEGTIDGQGEFWWKKYWGEDHNSGMRAEYEKRGLRWAVDYDCLRPRNLVVMNSKKVQISGITLCRSGFWNLHLCYSHDVMVKDVVICNNEGPSTDGIDIDSCKGVLVEGCKISCNDDNICLKSGRDSDGLRVNRPCEDVVIRRNHLLAGEGITLGSETSGGIRNIQVENNVMQGTRNGFRIKSARTRGGKIENIAIDGLFMEAVNCAFCFELDWYRAYSNCYIPKIYSGIIPLHWKKLLEPVGEEGLPSVQDITICNVHAIHSGSAFHISGLEEHPLGQINFRDIILEVNRLGFVKNIWKMTFQNTRLTCMEAVE